MKEQTAMMETERLYIRRLSEENFPEMAEIWWEHFPLLLREDPVGREEFLRESWREMWEDHILTGLLFLKDSGELCGRVNLQHTDREVPEVGVDILRAHRGKGYAPEAVKGFLNWYHQNHHIARSGRISCRRTV